ncbi:MAG: trigger factor [Caldilineales bacterium]
MKITTEQLPNCQIALTIEPDPERVEEALKRAARKVAKKYTVPGYRKGKAPYAAVVRAYGKEALYEQVVEDMGDEMYREALEESGLEPIAPGELMDVSFDPLVFHLVLPMAPEVDLGDYRSIRVERTEVVVEDEAVDKELAQLQQANADWVPVEDEGARYGDLVTMKIEGVEDDQVILEDDAFEIELQEENDDFPPGFDAALLGVKAEDALSFDLTYPEDWRSPARAGLTAHFDAVIHSVKRKELPALDDDFAPLVGDFDTLDDLKASIREGMLEELQSDADNEYANTALGQMIEVADIQYPEVLLDDYAERMAREQKSMISRLGIPFNEYLRLVGRTEAQFLADVRGNARQQLLSDLFIEELIEAEHLQPTEDEITERIQEMIERETEDAEGLRELLESEGGRHAMMHDIERRNAIRRVMAIADGTAPTLEEIEAQMAERAAQEAAAEAAASDEAAEDAVEELAELASVAVVSEEATVAEES